MTTVVTSCSLKGWDKYGARFVSTFDQYWPVDVALHVVSEDLLPHKRNGGSREIVFHSLVEYPPGQAFLDKFKEQLWVHGRGESKRPEGIAPQWKGLQPVYWFRYDAYKFSKKVFAIALIAELVKTGRLFWIDADVVTFAPVAASLFVNTLPSTRALSCLARANYHSECGYVGYNLDHPATYYFIKEFARLYTEEGVFKLSEWHDSWVFDWLRRKLITPTFEIPHSFSSHPFINSELGLYMDHLKGARKDVGASHPNEQHRHRKSEYWQRRV